jgi:hypothetical protein
VFVAFCLLVGKLGLSTCYDVRFPEMYLKLVELGAEFLLIPSAFTVPTGSAHWHVLLRGTFVLLLLQGRKTTIADTFALMIFVQSFQRGPLNHNAT